MALIIKLNFFKNSGIPLKWLCLLFIAKILAGIAYGLFYKQPRYYETADTWRFHTLSLKETDWLLQNPLKFSKDIFTYGYTNSGNVFSGTDSYWNDLKSNLVIKLLAVCNVLTNKSYYTNIILFNFLFFFGLVALLRIAQKEFNVPKWLIVIAIFLIPGTLFWCSGIHKDGLILSAVGMVIFWLHKIFYTPALDLKRVLGILILTFLIFLFRSYVALALLPAMLSWWLCIKCKINPLLTFACVYGAGIIFFFSSPFLGESIDFPAFLASKQHEFLLLNGELALPVQSLEPTISSYLKYLPDALDIAFLRPHISEAKNIAYLLATLELWTIGILIMLAFVFPLRQKNQHPLALFLLFFGVSLLIIAGYTVTFTGALVRYRSFALPFIILPILTFINFEVIKMRMRLVWKNIMMN